MPGRYEQVVAQVCADFDATLSEFNTEQDHVHLLAQYPPKVALSHPVNSLRGYLIAAISQGLRRPDQPGGSRDRF